MMHIVNKDNRDQYRSHLDTMWRQRQQVFINKLGWNIETDGTRELDQYDHDEAVYLLAINDKGELEGSLRLLPTTKPHLMKDIFPHLCARGVPEGPRVLEVSRFYSMTPPRHNILKNKCAGELLVGLMEYALLTEIERYTFVVSMAIFPLVLQAGWDITPLGLPAIDNDELIIAFEVNVSERGYLKMRERKQVTGTMVDLSPFGGIQPALNIERIVASQEGRRS